MVNHKMPRCLGLQAALSAVLLFVATSASAVTVDGNLSDLTAAITNETLPGNKVSATDPSNDGEMNGFDIVNGYAWYDVPSDTFYIGMNFAGQVGTSGGLEGGVACNNSSTAIPSYGLGTAGVFDGCETYAFNININNDASIEYGLRVYGDKVINSGINTEGVKTLTNDTSGLTLAATNWAVSESSNGVEFSVTGLGPLLGAFSIANPTAVTINLFAGSVSNTGPEDLLALNMQVVPVPAAVWLLGSGLVGLLGFSKRIRA